MAVTILISGQRAVRLDGESFTIGGDSACSIPLPGDDRVAPRHAVIRSVAGKWMVEAQNGLLIQVGEGRPTQMGWLNPGDCIRLTTTGPELIFEPQSAVADGRAPAALPAGGMIARFESPAHRAAVQTQHAPASPTPLAALTRSPLSSAFAGAGLLAAGLLLAVFVFWLAGAFRQPPSDSHAVVGTTSPEATAGRQPVENSAEGSMAPDVADGASQAGGASPISPATAVYLVTVVAGNDGATYQLGTAWAVSRNELITSGAIAAGLESLTEVAPLARAISPQNGRSIAIRSRRLHPRYQAAWQEAQQAQSEADSLRLDLEQAKNPAEVDSLTERLIAAEERRYQALERQADCDLAFLEVAGELPHQLAVAPPTGAPLKAGSKVSLWGVPFSQEEYVADPEHPLPVRDVTGSVLAASAGGAARGRWLLRCGRDFGSENWSGAPVVDSRGLVVGMYSRPTPPPPGSDERPAIQTHDITSLTAADIRRGAE